MIKIFVIGVAVAYMSIFFDPVTSQCGCNCRRQACSCCTNTTNTTTLKVCSSTCYDTAVNCYLYSTVCNSTLYQTLLNSTCACTCGFCNSTTTTTNACTGLAAGANIGPCINNACATGATCNTTTQNCICLTAGR